MMAESPVLQRIAVLQAAAEALKVLIRGTQGHQRQRCDLCVYSPEVVRYHLMHWTELRSATEGVSASGTNPLTAGGTRDHMKLVAIKADLELATDKAFTNGRYLTWQSVQRIYKRQDRESYLLARRRELILWIRAGHMVQGEPEPWKPLAEARCIEMIAEQLGWHAHEECEVA